MKADIALPTMGKVELTGNPSLDPGRRRNRAVDRRATNDIDTIDVETFSDGLTPVPLLNS